MKKTMIAFIVFSFLFCLSGCNNKNQPWKQHVYSHQDISFETEAEVCNIMDMNYSNDRIFIAMYLHFYKEESYSHQSQAEILSCNADGSDIQRIILEEDLEETETTYISKIVLYEDGSSLAVQQTSDDTNQRNELIRRNADGTIRWVKNTDILKDTQGNDAYIMDMFTDEDNITYLLCNGNKTLLFFLDPNGNVTNSKVINYVNNLKSMIMNKDKTFLFITYNEDLTKWFAFTYNPSANSYGEKEEIAINLHGYQLFKGISTDLILKNEIGIYSYNLGDTEMKSIMDFIDSDMEVSYFSNVLMLDNTCFAGAYKDLSDKLHIVIFR